MNFTASDAVLGARYQITNPMTRNAQFKAEGLNVDVLLVDKFGLHRILRREGGIRNTGQFVVRI